MANTSDNIDIIVPGESGLAIESVDDLRPTDVLWLGQNSGTVPKTITLAQLREYLRAGTMGTMPTGMFFPGNAANPNGYAYIISNTAPTQRPRELLPLGYDNTALQDGDRWYEIGTGIEWVRRGSFWIQPLQSVVLAGMTETVYVQTWTWYYWYPWWGLVWIGRTYESNFDGLTCWLQNPLATGIILEYVTATYFARNPDITSGYSYTAWIENANNAMVPQSYYSVANTGADMTLPPGNPVTQGSASVETFQPLQTIDWNPHSGISPGPYYSYWYFYSMKRCNTVFYRRRLFVPSNNIRFSLRDFRYVSGVRDPWHPERSILMAATLYYHWAK